MLEKTESGIFRQACYGAHTLAEKESVSWRKGEDRNTRHDREKKRDCGLRRICGIACIVEHRQRFHNIEIVILGKHISLFVKTESEIEKAMDFLLDFINIDDEQNENVAYHYHNGTEGEKIDKKPYDPAD
ncbi:MAG: hypothetical protein HGA77_04770 [Chlorobiaceae bacterium]|nr:hypothetical protein [Chlorobiaceae bacterium]